MRYLSTVLVSLNLMSTGFFAYHLENIKKEIHMLKFYTNQTQWKIHDELKKNQNDHADHLGEYLENCFTELDKNLRSTCAR